MAKLELGSFTLSFQPHKLLTPDTVLHLPSPFPHETKDWWLGSIAYVPKTLQTSVGPELELVTYF